MSQKGNILSVSILQPNLVWEHPDTNLRSIEGLCSTVSSTDLIILPEMFSTGFSMQPENIFETMDGPTVKWMIALAKKHSSVITGSLIIKENSSFFNRLIWASPDGSTQTYDKKHLFSFAGENQHYSSGNSRVIFNLKGWKVCPLICYDLRFPVWSRNQNLNGLSSDFEYDVLIYVANWPEARRKAWKTLLEARAHENQSYVIGVNRVGKDANQINHSGGSCIISPKGETLLDFEVLEEGIKTIELDLNALESFRNKFGVWRDKDQFSIT